MAFVNNFLAYSNPGSSNFLKPINSKSQNRTKKRIFDVALASALLVFLAPALLVISVAIMISSPGPIIFRQERYGLARSKFVIFKFRTMEQSACCDHFAQATVGDKRITSLGRFLRRTSLDELPQLVNVLKGDMSIVGPRPHALAMDDELVKEIPRYNDRFLVKPGITGLAQCKGFRGPTNTQKKKLGRIARDLVYVRRNTITLDISIMLQTIKYLMKSDAF